MSFRATAIAAGVLLTIAIPASADTIYVDLVNCPNAGTGTQVSTPPLQLSEKDSKKVLKEAEKSLAEWRANNRPWDWVRVKLTLQGDPPRTMDPGFFKLDSYRRTYVDAARHIDHESPLLGQHVTFKLRKGDLDPEDATILKGTIKAIRLKSLYTPEVIVGKAELERIKSKNARKDSSVNNKLPSTIKGVRVMIGKETKLLRHKVRVVMPPDHQFEDRRMIKVEGKVHEVKWEVSDDYPTLDITLVMNGVKAPKTPRQAKTTPPKKAQDNGAAEPKERDLVYVTQKGKKYHRGSCGYLRKSKIAIERRDAEVSYSPCSRCNP
jgi:hypothetical protein